MRLTTLAAVTIAALLAFAAPAFATTVTNVTLDNTTPSAAAGAKTVYRVGFKATTALAGNSTPGGRISVQFPSGTTFNGFGGTITRGTETLGGCSTPSGLVSQCSLNFSAAIAAGDTIVIRFSGVVN